MHTEFRVGELFCGAGGLALGATLAKYQATNQQSYSCKSVWGIDNNPWACETYRHNLGAEVHNKPVQEINFCGLAPIDGLLFGFPCNDYSVVGEHKGLNGNYGPLYTYGIKAIEAHNPSWFLAENVSGLASANEGEAFLRILQELTTAGSGYDVTAHLYRFEQYNVPQTRHRVVLVGIRRDLGKRFEVPAPTTENNPPGVGPRLQNIPQDAYNHDMPNHSPRTRALIDSIRPGDNAWSDSVPEHLRLNVPNCRLSHIYRRLHPDRPAHTVTARGGGGTHGYHWDEPRALTNRERARIQTFPDWFEFKGPKDEVRAQIGMAVPPEGARVIVEAIMKTLAGDEYPSVKPKWHQPAAEVEVAAD